MKKNTYIKSKAFIEIIFCILLMLSVILCTVSLRSFIYEKQKLEILSYQFWHNKAHHRNPYLSSKYFFRDQKIEKSIKEKKSPRCLSKASFGRKSLYIGKNLPKSFLSYILTHCEKEILWTMPTQSLKSLHPFMFFDGKDTLNFGSTIETKTILPPSSFEKDWKLKKIIQQSLLSHAGFTPWIPIELLGSELLGIGEKYAKK